MIRILVWLLVAVAIGNNHALAQDQNASKEEYELFQKTNAQLDSLKASFQTQTLALINDAPGLDNGRVYIQIVNELDRKYTFDQVKSYHNVLQQIDSLQVVFKQKYTEIITKGSGILDYNRIKRQQQQDSVLIIGNNSNSPALPKSDI